MQLSGLLAGQRVGLSGGGLGHPRRQVGAAGLAQVALKERVGSSGG